MMIEVVVTSKGSLNLQMDSVLSSVLRVKQRLRRERLAASS